MDNGGDDPFPNAIADLVKAASNRPLVVADLDGAGDLPVAADLDRASDLPVAADDSVAQPNGILTAVGIVITQCNDAAREWKPVGWCRSLCPEKKQPGHMVMDRRGVSVRAGTRHQYQTGCRCAN